jgi:hypothetical protein
VSGSPDDADPITRWKAVRAQAANVDNLSDEEKVNFTLTELSAANAMLDELLRRHDALRTHVEDPDGLVRFTLGNDGRLLELFVHEAIGQQLDNIAFETLFNSLLEAGNKAVIASLEEFGEHGLDLE